MSSGATGQDGAWKQKEQAEEAQYIRQKEQENLEAIREQMNKTKESVPNLEQDFEGGFGGQEGLEDRYATTSGDH